MKLQAVYTSFKVSNFPPKKDKFVILLQVSPPYHKFLWAMFVTLLESNLVTDHLFQIDTTLQCKSII